MNQEDQLKATGVAERLEWPEQEPSEFLRFQRSLWELASAIAAEHALSLPVDRRNARVSPAPPSYEPDWLRDAAHTAAENHLEVPPPDLPGFASACDNLDGLIAQLNPVPNNKD